MKKNKTKKIATAGLLYAIILLMQLVKNVSPFISGPVINTAMAIAAIEVGLWWGIGFSVLTPLMSILVAPASAMTAITQATYGVNLPIIIIGNIIFAVFVRIGSKKENRILIFYITLGAILKWLFMWGAADLIIKPIFSESLGKLMAAVNKVFSTLQLYSGLLSGIIIYPIITAIKKYKGEKKDDKT